MSIKKSEDFFYFQNKAQHYHNVRTARPAVQDKLPKNLWQTIDHIPHNRDLPYNRKAQIQFSNKHHVDRITKIFDNKQKKQFVVNKEGDYSRFNKFQRNFRKKNPQRTEADRLISIQNERYGKMLDNTKPRVGMNKHWNSQYKQKASFKRNLSRFDEGQRSKGEIKIQKEHYMMGPYAKYLEHLENSGEVKKSRVCNQTVQDNPETSRAKSSKIKHVKIDNQRLFILPSFINESSKNLRQSKIKERKENSRYDSQIKLEQ